MLHPPAALTFRYQSVPSPHGIGTMKPSSTALTTTGVRYTLPERRPRCSSTPYSGMSRVPANSIANGLNILVAAWIRPLAAGALPVVVVVVDIFKPFLVRQVVSRAIARTGGIPGRRAPAESQKPSAG